MGSDALPAGFQLEPQGQATAGAPSEDLPSGFQLDEDKYGGVSGALGTAALGAARSATLGLSDVALTKTGLMKPETLKHLEETNPISNFTGEVAGVFMPGGAAGLVGKAGKAVYGATKALKVMKLAEEATTVGKVLGATADIGAHALGSSVEGAIYSGVGNSMHEYALGDPNLNGEKILANFGNGALVGGTIGGVLKGASILAPPAVAGTRDALVGLKNFLIGTGDQDAGLVGRMIPETKLSQSLFNRMNTVGVDERTTLAREAADHLNAVHNNLQTATKTLNKEIRPLEAEALIKSADINAVIPAQQTVIDEMNKVHDAMRAEPEIYSQNAAAKLDRLRMRIVGELKTSVGEKDPLAAFNALRSAKQDLGDMVFTKVPNETTKDTVEILKGVSSLINDTIKDPMIFGDAGSRLAEHDDMMHSLYEFISPSSKLTKFQKDFGSNVGSGYKQKWSFDPKKVDQVFKQHNTIGGQQKMEMLDRFYDTIRNLPDHLDASYQNLPNSRFDKKALSDIIENSQSSIGDAHEKYINAIKDSKGGLGLKDLLAGNIALSHPILGAMSKAYNVIKNPIEFANKLAGAEKSIGAATKSINDGAQSIFTKGLKAVGRVKGPMTREWTEDSMTSYKKNRDEILAMIGSPDEYVDRLNTASKDIADAAPDTTSGFQQASIRGLQFLASKLPDPPRSSPFDKPYEPSRAQVSDFNRYKDLVDNPSGVFDHIKNGTLGPQDRETIMAVYPALYQEMSQTLLKAATDKLAKKIEIPYQTKQSISMFIGQPLDQSFTPMAIMANQIALQPKNPVQPNQSQSGRTRKTDFTIASRTGLHGEDKDA